MKYSLKKPDIGSLYELPEATSNLHGKKDPFSATVIDKYRICKPSSPNFCWHLVLDLEGSEMAQKYRSGQSIGVIPEGRFRDESCNLFHQALTDKIRLYSISSTSWGDHWDGNSVSICVKRDIKEDHETGALVIGTASNFICDAKIGDQLKITGPVGKSFVLPDNPLEHDYIFIATGTGIAPYRGMVMELFSQGFDRELWLIFGTPYSTDLMYDDVFKNFAERHKNFHYFTAISREQKNSDGDRFYVQDRLKEHEEQILPLLDEASSRLYLCGRKGMDYGIYRWLHRSNSKIVNLPEGFTTEEIQALPDGVSEWSKVDRARDRQRFFKETY